VRFDICNGGYCGQIKEGGMGWACGCRGEKENMYRVLMGELEVKQPRA
jgi:hypothetical protein